MDLSLLTKEMPFKWRVQTQNDKSAQCVAYIDSRQVAERLDEAVGPENWQSDYRVVKDNLYAGIAIWNDKINQWVWKWDCGTESNTEKEKGEASDAFKRAAVKWGIGRFLYDMDFQRVKVKTHTNGKTYPCDDNGTILWTGDDLTNYINNRIKAGIKSEPTDDINSTKRYEKPKEEPTYSVSPWSKEVMEKASKVEKDGLKGSAALSKYIPAYNEKKKTSYKAVSDFNNDKLLLDLITFVENAVPASLV